MGVGRPKGHKLSQESKDKMRQTKKELKEERGHKFYVKDGEVYHSSYFRKTTRLKGKTYEEVVGELKEATQEDLYNYLADNIIQTIWELEMMKTGVFRRGSHAKNKLFYLEGDEKSWQTTTKSK